MLSSRLGPTDFSCAVDKLEIWVRRGLTQISALGVDHPGVTAESLPDLLFRNGWDANARAESLRIQS